MHPSVQCSPIYNGLDMEATKCPSTEACIQKMWYIETMEEHSAIKGNETGSFGKTWMDLQTVIQREVSQKEKNKHYILIHTREI